jgi:hypothetical protein
MGDIDWLPISELPEAFKDGRQLLLWAFDCPVLWRWLDGPENLNGMLHSATHFAEINSP